MRLVGTLNLELVSLVFKLIREEVGLASEALKELLWGGVWTEPVQLDWEQVFSTGLEGKELRILLLIWLECVEFIALVSLPGSLKSVERGKLITEGPVLALSLEINWLGVISSAGPLNLGLGKVWLLIGE